MGAVPSRSGVPRQEKRDQRGGWNYRCTCLVTHRRNPLRVAPARIVTAVSTWRSTRDATEKAPGETDEKLRQLKEANRAAAKTKRAQIKRSRDDEQRRTMLVGEAVLCRVARGEMGEDELRTMMDEALSRPADRALFDLE
jgi:hypothetical protein